MSKLEARKGWLANGGMEKLAEAIRGRKLKRNQTQNGTHPHLGDTRLSVIKNHFTSITVY